MKTVRKLLRIAFLLAVLVGCLMFHASAATVVASGYCGGEGNGTNLTWTLDSNGTLNITGTGAMAKYKSNDDAPWYSNCSSIKKVVIGDSVTTIGDYAFDDCDSLTTVPMGDGVTTIGKYAFSHCDSLTTVEIPNSATTIGVGAFRKCNSLTTVKIPNNVTTIGDYAFYSCDSLITVTIGNSVTTIGDYAFSYCTSLAMVTMGDSVTTIGDWAFENCRRLTTVEIPDSVTTIGDWAFYWCERLTTVEIPDSVTIVGKYAFSRCDRMTSVYFEGNAPAVGTAAFNAATLYYDPATTGWTDSGTYDASTGTWNGYKLEVWKEKAYVASGYCGGEGNGTNLKWSLDREGTLAITGIYAMEDYEYSNMPWYSYCSSINNVVIGDHVTTIGDNAFRNCPSLTAVTIGARVTTIGEYAFCNCTSLTTAEIPDSVKTLGTGAFLECTSLTMVTMGNSVTTIGEGTFWGCDNMKNIEVAAGNSFFCSDNGILFNKEEDTIICYPAGRTETKYAIPDRVTIIGEYAFYLCDSLTTVEIPDSVTTIGDDAFYLCDSLTTVEIPDSVTTVGDGAFSYCLNLTTVTIGNSVTAIGKYAFWPGSSLASVHFEGDAPSVYEANDDWASFRSDKVTLYYDPATVGWTDSAAYDAVTGTWNGYRLKIRGVETGTFTNNGRSLELDGIVYINHYTIIDGFGDPAYVEENGGLLVWKNAVTEEEATFENAEDVNAGLVYDAAAGEYLARTDGIPTKEFADELYLRTYVLAEDGNYYYGELKPYSVKEYCEGRIAKSTSSKMKALAAAMLHYGAAAQTYFKYNLNKLANADITVAAETYKATLINVLVPYTSAPSYTVDTKVTGNGKALTLEGAILIDFYFKAPSTYKNGVLQVWENTTKLTERNISYEVNMEYDAKNKEWHGQSNGIAAKLYGKTIYARAKFTNASGAVKYGPVVSYSVEEYAAGRIAKSTDSNMVELAKRLVIYGERARVYFG